MSRRPFNCLRCGHCCLNLIDAYRGCISDDDLQRWKKESRADILCRIDSLDLGRGNILHFAWVDPETREDVERCPWLGELPGGTGYICGIEKIKPEHCRHYPQHRKHAKETGCPGYSAPAAASITTDGHKTPSQEGNTHG